MKYLKRYDLANNIKLNQVLMGFLFTLIILLANYTQFFYFTEFNTRLNSYIYDNFLKSTPPTFQRKARVVIIDIDEKSIKKEGRWPWPRDKLAALVTSLSDYGVVTIALDIVMPEGETNSALDLKNKISKLNLKNIPPGTEQFLSEISPLVDNDMIFAKALSDKNAIPGFLFHYYPDADKGRLPEPEVNNKGEPFDASRYNLIHFKGYSGSYDLFTKAAGKGGFVTNIPDSDGAIRRSLLLASFNNQIYSSLALQTVMNYLLIDRLNLLTEPKNGKLEITGLDLDGIKIPLDNNAQVMIPYLGKPGTLDYYSASDILQKKIKPHNLEGSIAVIGSSMILLADLHNTPLSTVFPGVEVIGNLITGIISNHITTYYDWASGNGFFTLLLIGLILSFFCSCLKITYKLFFMIFLMGLVLILSYLFYLYQNIYITPAILLLFISTIFLTNYAYIFYLERKQKKYINNLFGQYVPKEYVEQLVQNPDGYDMNGITREMTVIFADIRDFTTISEKLDASGVKRLLNTFFTPVTEIIFEHQGTIDKYVGDMIVAFWGAPLPDEQHSAHAVEASLKIFDKLDEINNTMISDGLPPVNIGIGIGTGKMNVGDMGSEFRRSYTVLGDVVNISSRLQDLTKFYQVNILVTESTTLKNNQFLWRKVDVVAVKGRKSFISIYEPVSLMSQASESKKEEIVLYKKALQLYFSKQFEASKAAFEQLMRTYPNVYLYDLYLNRSIEFINTPPPEKWAGVYIHTTK